jgi:glycosyltransferase involved in cell wall biosynthesis
MRILHLTSILPAPLERKQDENNILIEIASKYQITYPFDSHSFILVIPYSNWFLSKLKKRWKEYYDLSKKKRYELNGFDIAVINRPGFKGDKNFRRIFAVISFYMNRKLLNEVFLHHKPDLIHAHTLGGDSELAQVIKKNKGIKFVATTRELTKISLKNITNKRITPLRLLAHSQVNQKNVIQNTDIPINLIPHPVETGFFSNKINESTDILKLVSVGRLIPGKNIEKVIKALASSSINYNYSIFGTGSEENKLEETISSLGLKDKIQLKGKISHDQLMLELNRYDLFVLPSAKETFGRVYFEAMASAVPVIAARNTGIDGYITNKKEGYLVNPNDINEIKYCIEEFYYLNNTDKDKMKKQCMQLAKITHWDIILQQYHDFYYTANKLTKKG